MSKQPSTELVPSVVSTGLQTGVDAQVNKDDVLVIASVQAEEIAEENIARALGEAEDAGKRVVRHYNEANAAIAARAKEEWLQAEEDLTAAIKAVDPKAKITTNISSGLDHPDYDADEEPEDGKRTPVYKTFHSEFYIGVNGNNLHFSRKLKLTKEAIRALKARDAAQREKDAAEKEAMEWKRRQARIPFLEKKARAKLGVRELQKTEEGRAILEQLIGNVTDEVLQLPSR